MTKKNAAFLAGFFLGMPAWEKKFVFPDDTEQWGLYSKNLKILLEEQCTLNSELDFIRNWFLSGDQYLHVNKILAADEIC